MSEELLKPTSRVEGVQFEGCHTTAFDGWGVWRSPSDPYHDFLAAHPQLNDSADTRAAFDALRARANMTDAMQEDGK